MTETSSRKKVGLALGGGFIRSAAHIGVLEVFAEHGITIDMISGCSAGAAIASTYAAGTLPQLKQRLMTIPPQESRRIIADVTLPRRGLFRGEANQKFFEEFLGQKNFSDLSLPLCLVATDLRNMEEVVIDDGQVSRALRACMMVPGFYVPIEEGGKVLVDGGHFNLLPTKQLYERGMDYVIAVDVSKAPNTFTRTLSWLKQLFNIQPLYRSRHDSHRPLHILEIIRRSIHLSSSYIHNLHHSAYRYDMLIQPDVVGVRRWHISKTAYLVERGRIAALAAIPQIKKDLGLV